MARAEQDTDIKLGEAFRVADLALAMGFLFREIFEIFVIGQDGRWELGVCEEMAPVLQAFNRGEELGVMDVVIPFRGRQRTGIETKRMQDAISIWLAADGAEGVLGGIRF